MPEPLTNTPYFKTKEVLEWLTDAVEKGIEDVYIENGDGISAGIHEIRIARYGNSRSINLKTFAFYDLSGGKK